MRLNTSLGSNSKLRRKPKWVQLISMSPFRLFLQDYTCLLLLTTIFTMLQIYERMCSLESTANTQVETDRLNFGMLSNSLGRKSSDPPSYLPLAQHLRNTNVTKLRPSLEDMVYGSQRRTRSDLLPTLNSDMDSSGDFRYMNKRLDMLKIDTMSNRRLARILLRIVSFYKIKSVMTMPCEKETTWMFQLVHLMKEMDHDFMHYCTLRDDSMVVQMMRTFGTEMIEGTEFIVYNPTMHGRLPKADMVFVGHGTEKQGLDETHDFFKDVVMAEINYTLVENTPGAANAILVENEAGTFSIARPHDPALNVRAFPFGFNEAERVIPMKHKQLLMYNTTLMRDVW